MKTNFCFISRHLNGGEYFSRYFHGAQEELSLDHEFHKCMFHGHENKDNQFFMALSRLFNTNWFHSVVDVVLSMVYRFSYKFMSIIIKINILFHKIIPLNNTTT